MYYFLIFILFLLFMTTKEGYINYQEISFQGIEQNCPQIHADNSQILKSSYQMIQPFGYTKNELFDMTRFIETDIPLPTDPDFFKHI